MESNHMHKMKLTIRYDDMNDLFQQVQGLFSVMQPQ
jgi:hypothetical protein